MHQTEDRWWLRTWSSWPDAWSGIPSQVGLLPNASASATCPGKNSSLKALFITRLLKFRPIVAKYYRCFFVHVNCLVLLFLYECSFAGHTPSQWILTIEFERHNWGRTHQAERYLGQIWRWYIFRRLNVDLRQIYSVSEGSFHLFWAMGKTWKNIPPRFGRNFIFSSSLFLFTQSLLQEYWGTKKQKVTQICIIICICTKIIIINIFIIITQNSQENINEKHIVLKGCFSVAMKQKEWSHVTLN